MRGNTKGKPVRVYALQNRWGWEIQPYRLSLNIYKKASDQAPLNPRTAARKSKLRSLKPEQRQALITWLFKDKLTYAAAHQRLLEKFGVSLSAATIHEFWDENSRAQLLQPGGGTLLDIVIKAACPMRLTVQKDGKAITLTKLPC